MHDVIVDNIRRLINEKGLRQNAVAQKAKFSERQFSDMLMGRKTIKAEYIPAIAKALCVDPNALFIDQSSGE